MAAAAVVRAGGPEDAATCGALLGGSPLAEHVAMAGSAERAGAFLREVVLDALRHGGSLHVAELDGRPAGFALVVTDGGDVPPPRRLVPLAVRALGVRAALAAGLRASGRLGVDLRPPPGGLHLLELHVDEGLRGRGLGAALLDAVGRQGRAAGVPHLSLTTGAANPARRLYERHGFRVAGERQPGRHARRSGVGARVLYVRDLRSDVGR